MQWSHTLYLKGLLLRGEEEDGRKEGGREIDGKGKVKVEKGKKREGEEK